MTASSVILMNISISTISVNEVDILVKLYLSYICSIRAYPWLKHGLKFADTLESNTTQALGVSDLPDNIDLDSGFFW